MDQLIKIIEDLIRSRFTGSVKINFFKGGISSIDKNETMKLEEGSSAFHDSIGKRN